MSDLVREKLAEIISQFGPSICNNPVQVEKFLKDLCPKSNRKIYILIQALKEGVAASLQRDAADEKIEILFRRLIKRLVENRCVTVTAASWAVNSWALALGVIKSSIILDQIETGPSALKPRITGTIGIFPSSSNGWQEEIATRESFITSKELSLPKMGEIGKEKRGDRSFKVPSISKPETFFSFGVKNVILGIVYIIVVIFLFQPKKPGLEINLGNNITMKFVLIPIGNFLMGSTDARRDEKPIHIAEIPRQLYFGIYEVTQAQYMLVSGKNPALFKSLNKPVEQVSAIDAIRFCNKLSQIQELEECYSFSGTEIICDFNKNGFRLPTETEWEYACRSGNERPFYWGTEINEQYCWYFANSKGYTQEVGLKIPNSWGLYDMSGNVSEWCWGSSENYFPENLIKLDASLAHNFGERGGSWRSDAERCRAAARQMKISPDERSSELGFRVCRLAQ